MNINFLGPVFPTDPYAQMAFVEILNTLLVANNIMEVNRMLIHRNANPAYGSLSGYFRWSYAGNHFTLWHTIPRSVSDNAYSVSISECWQAGTGNGIVRHLTELEYMNTITIENREIAIMAFDKLCRENKKDSALRLAGCMLKHSYISLGIGDIDWEIDMAIRQCGGEPRTGYRYTARFHFNLKTEMEKEKYDRAVKELYG